jgi:hypothetical protein
MASLSARISLLVLALFVAGCAAQDPPADHNAVRIRLSFDNTCKQVDSQQKRIQTELADVICKNLDKDLNNVVFVKGSFEDKSIPLVDSQCYALYDCLATKQGLVREILGRCTGIFGFARGNLADEIEDKTGRPFNGVEIEETKVEKCTSFRVDPTLFKQAMVTPARPAGK